ALGTVAHTIGTAQAFHISQKTGAFATLALCINGVMYQWRANRHSFTLIVFMVGIIISLLQTIGTHLNNMSINSLG
ncbi:MAG: hypothetical protein ACI8R8_002727, partial [Paraglaciecola sp.]